jgi:hypothetical protein
MFQKRVFVVDEVNRVLVWRKRMTPLVCGKKAGRYSWQESSLQVKQAQQFVEFLLIDIFYENLKRGRTMAGRFAWKVKNFFSLCHSRRNPLHGFLFYEKSVTVYLCVACCSVMYIIYANYSKGLKTDETLRRYISNWLRHVTRKNNSRKKKAELYTCRRSGRTRLGRLEENIRRGRNRSTKFECSHPVVFYYLNN